MWDGYKYNLGGLHKKCYVWWLWNPLGKILATSKLEYKVEKCMIENDMNGGLKMNN